MLTQAKLRELLSYDMDSGELIWRRRPRHEFTSDSSFKTFNLVRAGKVAGNIDCLEGYRKIGVLGRLYRAHRLVWLYAYGAWPVGEIDHINQQKADNRLENLRVVTRGENEKNKPRRKDNKSGHVGVHFHKYSWIAEIGNTYLGGFPTKEQAIDARRAAERDRGYHENHGAG